MISQQWSEMLVGEKVVKGNALSRSKDFLVLSVGVRTNYLGFQVESFHLIPTKVTPHSSIYFLEYLCFGALDQIFLAKGGQLAE